MSIMDFFDSAPIWGILAASLLLTGLSIEAGFRAGRWRRKTLGGAEEVQAGPFVAATLGLLAFMLAMVFSAVMSRHQEAKHAVLDEVNAISTTFLRADLLPPAKRAEVRQLLSDYVALRIEAARSDSDEGLESALARSEELQRILWSRAATLAVEQPTPTSALFVDSVNTLIDIHETRVTLVIRYRLPGMIWTMLLALAVVAMAMGGYGTGVSGSRQLLATTLFTALAFSIVLALPVVLDRPHHDLSAATRAPMVALEESIDRLMESEHLPR